MPRLTKEERAELEARLAEDDDEDDDEIEIGRPDGSYVRGKTRRLRSEGYLDDSPASVRARQAADDADKDGKPSNVRRGGFGGHAGSGQRKTS